MLSPSKRVSLNEEAAAPHAREKMALSAQKPNRVFRASAKNSSSIAAAARIENTGCKSNSRYASINATMEHKTHSNTKMLLNNIATIIPATASRPKDIAIIITIGYTTTNNSTSVAP